MPRPSKLREAAERGPREWEPRGTNRKLYDPDACPEGCDPDIWQLALYFQDKSTQNGMEGVSMPAVYEFLKKGLTNLPPPDIRARARSCDIQLRWSVIVEKAIDEYYSDPSTYEDVSTTYLSIIKFSSPMLLDYYIQRTIDTIVRTELLRTGVKVTYPDREAKPGSKRTERQKEVAKILQRKLTEEELAVKLEEWKSRRDNG